MNCSQISQIFADLSFNNQLIALAINHNFIYLMQFKIIFYHENHKNLPADRQVCVPIFLSKRYCYLSFLVFNRIEFPITITSEKAIANAPNIGFKNPNAAIGMATTL